MAYPSPPHALHVLLVCLVPAWLGEETLVDQGKVSDSKKMSPPEARGLVLSMELYHELHICPQESFPPGP